MDKMTTDKIRVMLCSEIDEIAEKGVLSAGDLDALHKLTDTVKNLDKIEMLEEYSEDDGYEQDGGWEARGNYGRTGGRYSRADEMIYERGNSYAGQRRNSMGRYSRAEAQDELMKKLRMMAEDKSLPERYRETAKKAMAEMK